MNQQKYKDRIIKQPPIQLCACPAKEFPSGIQKAWNCLENKIDSLRGRKFYGLTIPDGNELRYYAGVVPKNNEEIEELNFPVIQIEGGKFKRVILRNWTDRTSEISTVFDYLISKYNIKKDKHCLEFYKSQVELHLLVPLKR